MNISATEREEGEISDDYEIISDESIDSHTAEKSGKCTLPPQELTPTISLSSVSDNYSDGEGKSFIASSRTHSKKCSKGHSKRKVCRRTLEKRRSSYPKPKRKKYSDDSDSESDLEIVNKSIKRQLKEAVQVADKRSVDKCTNSLQTRLQRMINPNYSVSKPVLHEEDEEVLALRDIALLSTQKKEEEEIVMKTPINEETLNTSTDQELTELRIIALKSAFLKKHQNRKQKKENVDMITDTVEMNSPLSAEEESKLISEKNTTDHVEYEIEIEFETKIETVQNDILTASELVFSNENEKNENVYINDHQNEEESKIKENSNEEESEIKENSNEEESEIKENANEEESIDKENNNEEDIQRKENIEEDNQRKENNDEEDNQKNENIDEEDNQKNENSNEEDDKRKENNNEEDDRRKKNNNEENEENIEEDEDIMRAMLLASMSKKITSESKNSSNKILKDAVNSKDNKVKNKLVTVLPQAPITKIIINVNTESDSDNEPVSVLSNDNKIDKNFDKNLSLLLKQAREKVEKNEDSILDKSVVKLLPRSQQAEYKQLKHKLQLLKAKRKTTQKLKRLLPKIDDTNKDLNKKNNLLIKKTNKVRTFGTKLKINNVLKNKQLINNKIVTATSSQELKRNLQPTVQERFQEKNRYEELEPLMRQIDEIRKKRDEEQLIVQNLLSQLKIARNRLSSVHQHFTSLVQKLVSAKADIDKCTHSENTTADNGTKSSKTVLCTSTPNKIFSEPQADINLELSTIVPQVDKNLFSSEEHMKEDENVKMIINTEQNKCNDEDIFSNDVIAENDPSTKSTCLTYVSPLAHMNSREGFEDPFLIICPYELQGVCRDTECKFQHCAPS